MQQTNIHNNLCPPASDAMMFHNFIIQSSCLSTGCVIEKNIDYRGYNLARTEVENQMACAKLSFSNDGALFWTYQPSTKLCWAKRSKTQKIAMEGVVSGNNECVKEGESRGLRGLQIEVRA